MTQPLGVWRVPASDGGGELEPQRVGPGTIGLEKVFEDWIARDATLITDGATIVGRQVSVDESGRLDLLAIDAHDHWLVIEVKPGLIGHGALCQALYYAAGIASLSSEALLAKLVPRLADFGVADDLAADMQELLDGEEEGDRRDVSILLVGAGVDPGLARVTDYLARFGVPITIVSFQVFELAGGERLLIREVPDPVMEPTLGRKLTVDTIRDRADELGYLAQFDRFIAMSEAAGLAVQPQRASVRIAPMANRTRYLMYLQPHRGGLRISAGARQFAEFFPHVTEKQASDALDVGGPDYVGEALDEHLDRIEKFLTERISSAVQS